MSHEVCLRLDELPLISVAGAVTAQHPFIHQDRIMDEHVLIYLFHGEMQVVEDGVPHRVREGEFLFLKAGVHHWGEAVIPAGTSWFYVHFSSSGQLDEYQKYGDFVTGVKQQELSLSDYRCYLALPKHAASPRGKTEQRIRELLEAYHSSSPLRPVRVNSILFQLLADLYQAAHQEQKTDKADVTVRKTIDFLEAHSRQPLSSEEIALHMRLSYKYLCTVFRAKTGLSINQYHTRIRISEAARLLRETSLNVSESGFAVGYRDPLYFSSVFKKVMGKSPSEYLKQSFIGS
ncbi:MAG: AraC family transcriptional regulator [Oscillospiraceae bacterium]|jgi:AraC family transcriptional regulator of arabinose operon